MAKEPNQSDDATSDHPKHFVREWREFSGWTQEELAAMADVSLSKISRIENSKRGLKTGFLRELAAIFKVPPSALLDINPATEDGARTAHMLRAWNLLTSSQQADMLRMMRALTNGDDAGGKTGT